eukprot:scaffold3224_cov172-Pinguiococcus_pyrenoidosus.AAC.2
MRANTDLPLKDALEMLPSSSSGPPYKSRRRFERAAFTVSSEGSRRRSKPLLPRRTDDALRALGLDDGQVLAYQARREQESEERQRLVERLRQTGTGYPVLNNEEKSPYCTSEIRKRAICSAQVQTLSRKQRLLAAFLCCAEHQMLSTTPLDRGCTIG